MTSHLLTRLEQRALARAISMVAIPTWRDALLRQAAEVRVKSRTVKTVGYYVDFEVPSALRIPDLPDNFNKHPPEVEADHPDGKNGIFFLVYIKEGVLSFMEASSTADWPEDEDQIIFVDQIESMGSPLILPSPPAPLPPAGEWNSQGGSKGSCSDFDYGTS